MSKELGAGDSQGKAKRSDAPPPAANSSKEPCSKPVTPASGPDVPPAGPAKSGGGHVDDAVFWAKVKAALAALGEGYHRHRERNAD